MSCKLVYSNIDNELRIPTELLPEDGVPFKHHFQSTVGDNLIEMAGRVCYDSSKSKNTRSSMDYHMHIIELNHGSVQEHLQVIAGLVVKVEFLLEFSQLFWNKPGIFVRSDPFMTNGYIVTANIRAIREGTHAASSDLERTLFDLIGRRAVLQAPLACSDITTHLSAPKGASQYFSSIYYPRDVGLFQPHEIWFSFYISNISRSLSHELIRHRYQSGVSQRSTRYCDESESDWMYHPYLIEFKDQLNWSEIEEHQNLSKSLYSTLFTQIRDILISRGVDKFSAIKQSRGAARGVLGNALSTELIYSCSLWELKNILKQRLSPAADLEIKQLAENMTSEVTSKFPHIL